MVLDIFLSIIIGLIGYLIFNKINNNIEDDEPVENNMGLNNATLIVKLKDFDASGDVFYVGLSNNPEETLKKENSFMNFIQYSTVVNSFDRAVELANELEKQSYTTRGILKYDGYQKYTLGQVILSAN